MKSQERKNIVFGKLLKNCVLLGTVFRLKYQIFHILPPNFNGLHARCAPKHYKASTSLRLPALELRCMTSMLTMTTIRQKNLENNI